MAIQNRRGVYANFDATKMVAGEIAVVQSDDPNTTDGKAIYISYANGTAKRIAGADEVEDVASDLSDLTEDLGDLSDELTSVKDDYYYTGGIPLEYGTIDSTSGTDVADSTRLRSIGYIDSTLKSMSFNSNCYAYISAYQDDGTYVGRYTGSGFSTNWQNAVKVYSPISMDTFAEYDYVYRFIFARTDGTTLTKEYLSLSATFSVMESALRYGGEIYTIGENRDFETFTGMLIALKDNTNVKTVFVYGGEYDIFDEIGGAEYISGVDTSKNWRDLNNLVPPNTTIIGVGNVVLAWNPTDAEIIDQTHASLFSPLNISGSCTIKNIKIECSNCRYGIHDETSGKNIYDSTVHRYDNVKVDFRTSTYGIKYAYGAGHNKNSKYYFTDCTFSAGFGTSWSMHDWPAGIDENSLFVFDNCVFWDSLNDTLASVRFSSSDTLGRLDNVRLNGCAFSGIVFGTEGSSNVKQGYNVTTLLCKPYSVTYSDYILASDRIKPTDYNISNDLAGIAIMESASGSIAHLDDGANLPAKNVVVNINSGSGATGTNIFVKGKNLLPAPTNTTKSSNGIQISVNNGVYTLSGLSTAQAEIIFDLPEEFSLDGSMKTAFLNTAANNNVVIYYRYNYTNGTSVGMGTVNKVQEYSSSTSPGPYNKIRFLIPSGQNVSMTISPMLMLKANANPSVFAPYKSTKHTISWQSSAGTVNAGVLNVTTGELTVTSPTAGTYQLPATDIMLLRGTNNIWADVGDTTVDYQADTKAYIDNLVNQSTEDDWTANTNIASGKIFAVGDNLLKATSAIATGETIVPGSNCTETSIVEQLNYIISNL